MMVWASKPRRDARYQAFAQTLLPGEVLMTAQHLDDQCETFLLALKRGSGPAGLSAMGKALRLPEPS
jgi:tRNA(Ile)-lysidine synthase